MSQQCPHCRLAVQGNDIYQTLRYDPARATIAALQTARWKEQARPGAPRERNQVLRQRPPRPAYPADRAFTGSRGTHSGGK